MTNLKKTRLDSLLAERGLSATREKAKREILSGWVRVDGETVRDPSRRVSGEESILVQRPGGLYASRGGEKLAHALKIFKIDLGGKSVADLGASTGGFTDCVLKNGAALVYAIDVGYGQLDFGLRSDSRVIVMERTNVKSLEASDFDHKIDFITADLSFISITKVYDKIKGLFPAAEGIMLIKPQFEAQRGQHKKGVVKKRDSHIEILTSTISVLVEKGLKYTGLCYSPVKGPAGNIEFLLYFSNDEGRSPLLAGSELDEKIVNIVDEAHERLN